MKKIIKKSLILLLLLLVNIKGVNAFTVGQNFTLNDESVYRLGMIVYHRPGDSTYNQLMHWAYTGDESNIYTAYCLDPGHSIASDRKYHVSRVLMTESSYLARDYGLLTILKSAGEHNIIPGSEDYDNKVYTVQHAVRMYIDVFLNWATFSFYNETSWPHVQAYAGTVYKEIAKDPNLQAAYKELTGANYTDIIERFKLDSTKIPYFEGGSITSAMPLLREGVEAALNYKGGTAKITDVQFEHLGNFPDEAEDEDIKIAIVELKLNSIDALSLNSITINNSTNIISTELIGVSETYSESEFSYAPRAVVSSPDGEKTFYLAYRIKHNVPAEGEETISGSVTLDLTIEGTDSLTGAILRSDKETTDGATNQRFVVFENTSDGIKRNLTISLDAEPKPPEEEKKDPCDPEYEMPPVCEDDPEGITENGTVTYSFKEGYKDGKSSIIACIVGNTDIAGNDYKLQDSRAAVVTDNPYCAVYCKEDYNFELPQARKVDNGRFFQIRFGMKGQQDCYLSRIDKAQFDKDIMAAQEDVIDAYNDWLKYYELANAISLKQFIGTGEYDTCYDEKCSKETDDDGKLKSCSEEEAETYSSAESMKVVFKGTYYAYSKSGGDLIVTASDEITPDDVTFNNSYTDPTLSCTKNGESCSSSGSSKCTLEEGDDAESLYKAARDEETTGYIAKEASKKDTLKEKIKILKEIIDEYNSCMDDADYEAYSDTYADNHTWDVVYDFEPEVSYSYQEPDPTSIDTPKWITEVRSLGADVMEPVKVDPKSEDPAEYVKSGYCEDDSEDSKCKVVDTVDLIFGGESPVKEYCKESDLDKETYECSAGTTNPTYSNNNYFNCEIDDETGAVSCGAETYKVTNIYYLHKVAVAGGTYDTKRVYHSYHTDGSIVISSELPDEHNYDTVDGLPVGINTPYGTYLYQITLNNIGKFYSNGELGRIYSDNPNSLIMMVKDPVETSDGETVKENQYVCSYSVPREDTSPDKWCKMDDEGNYYVCPSDEINDECEEMSYELAIEETSHHDECIETPPPSSDTYCYKEGKKYYVCPKPGEEIINPDEECSEAYSVFAAIKASKHPGNCEEKNEKYCYKVSGDCYVCNQQEFDKNPEICTNHHSNCEFARSISDHPEDCEENKYCIRRNNYYYVCTVDNPTDAQLRTRSVCKPYYDDSESAKNSADVNVSCSLSYCVKNNGNYYSCPFNHYDEACTSYSTREDAMKYSDVKDGCLPNWCYKKDDSHYYVCSVQTPTDEYLKDEKICTSYGDNKDGAKRDSEYDGNCDVPENTYCVEHDDYYYVCPKPTYDEKCTSYRMDRDEAIKNSLNHDKCPVPEDTWCVKRNNKYYVCPEENPTDLRKCDDYKYDRIAARNASNYKDECNKPTYCVRYDNDYYVCTQSTYQDGKDAEGKTICLGPYDDETAITRAENDEGCGPRYCRKYNEEYYSCLENQKPKDGGCEGPYENAEDAINNSDVPDECLENKWCYMTEDFKYYSCKTSSPTKAQLSDNTICKSFGDDMESAIKASGGKAGNCKAPKKETYCLKDGGQYYVCTEKVTSYDARYCSNASYATAKAAIQASDNNINCDGELTYCVENSGQYYICPNNEYEEDDCNGPYKKSYAVDNSDDNGSCVNYCVKREDKYYACSVQNPTNAQLGDNKICESFEDDALAARSASDITSDCVDDPEEPRYCIRTTEGYYACKTDYYSSDPNICTKYASRAAALAAVGCSADGENCEANLSCKCPNCTVRCYDVCIQKRDDKTGESESYQLLFNFNTITPAKVNINDREMGYNWDVNNPKNVLVARKAANTISEIEARSNVKNVSDPVVMKNVEDYDFKVQLSPGVTTWVREYNRSQLNSGSYNNDTMECYDYDVESDLGISDEVNCKSAGYAWKNDKCVMTNIFCYSKFIDQLIDEQPDAFDGDNDTVERRNKSKTASYSNYTAYSALPHTETPIVTNDYWTIYVYDKLDINGDGIPDIGPSWK